MPLKRLVIDAFATLGLETDAEYAVASKAYKKLALQHHPDKNRDDDSATQRFQEISMAWDVCSRHYENPRSSEQSAYGYDDDDDEMDDMEEDAMRDFFEFMFERMFSSGGYHRRDRHDWREGHRQPQHGHSHSHSHGHGPGFGFSTGYGIPINMFGTGSGGGGGYSRGGYDPYDDDYYGPPDPEAQRRAEESRRRAQEESHRAQEYQARRDDKQRQEYLKRVREFEEQVKREEAEQKRQVHEASKAQDRVAQLRVTAFKAGRTGDGALLRRLVEEHDMDVTSPEKINTKSAKGKKNKNGGEERFETMLHAAARGCDEETLKFLMSKGADPALLTEDSLSAYHIALLYSNAPAVRFFLSLKPTPENCHPSRASPDGRMPLQLAMEGTRSKGNKDKAVEVLKLVVKDATVHIVEKCWSESLDDSVKEVLRSKKGFLPPAGSASGSGAGTSASSAPLSRKAQKKLEEQRAAEEKAQKIAEERARADAKRKVKEEKARAREAEAQSKREEEEAIRLVDEAIRREQEEEERQRLEVERAARAKVEAAEHAREEQRQRVEREKEKERNRLAEIKRREEEVKRKEAELARKEAALKKRQADAEAALKAKVEAEAAAKAKAEAEAKANEARERQRKEREAAARAEAEARQAQEELERQRQAASSQKATLETERQRKAQEARAKHMAEEAARRKAKEDDEARQRNLLMMIQAEQDRFTEAGERAYENNQAYARAQAAAQRQVCRHWQMGNCRFDAKCRYYHGLTPELAAMYYPNAQPEAQVPSPPPTASPPLSSPTTADPPAPSQSQRNGPACRFFNKGNCKYGSRCRNLHIDTAAASKFNPSSTPASAATPTFSPSANPPISSLPPTMVYPDPPKAPASAAEEEKKKRAAQSARDKARHQASVSSRRSSAAEVHATSGTKSSSRLSSKAAPEPTPSPAFGERVWESSLMSPPMTPEDVQTMAIPDELFVRQVPDKNGGVRDIDERPASAASGSYKRGPKGKRRGDPRLYTTGPL